VKVGEEESLPEPTSAQRTVLLEEARGIRKEGKAMSEAARKMDRLLGSLGGRGRLTWEDLVDFTSAQASILELLMDGQKHTEDEMIRLTGQRQATRRMRQLRPGLERLGWGIKAVQETEAGKRSWTYRLQKLQGELLP
jgi:hypothetical protein